MKKNWYYLIIVGLLSILLPLNFNNYNVNSLKLEISSMNANNVLASQDNNIVINDGGNTLDSDTGFTCTSSTITKAEGSTSFSLAFTLAEGKEENYFVGYNGTGSENCPALLKYTLHDSKGNKSEHYQEIIKFSSTMLFDGLGSDLGQRNFNTYVDITHPVDCSVSLDEPLSIINVFKYDASKETDITNRKPAVHIKFINC